MSGLRNTLANCHCEESFPGRTTKQSGGVALALRLPRPSGACGEAPEPSGLAMTLIMNFRVTTLGDSGGYGVFAMTTTSSMNSSSPVLFMLASNAMNNCENGANAARLKSQRV